MSVRSVLVVALLAAGVALLWRAVKPERARRPARMHEQIVPDGGAEQGPRTPMPLVPPAGTEIEIVLGGAPARWYAAPGSDDPNDIAYRHIVAELAAELGAGPVRYDWSLARAAREIAYQTAVLGYAPPDAAMPFLLHAAGAPDETAAQLSTHTSSDEHDVVRETVQRAIEHGAEGPLYIGIGEASTPGNDYRRHVVVLAARRGYELEPASRQVEGGAAWTVRGRLLEPARDLAATVLHPDGRIEEAAVRAAGSDFEITVLAGDDVGTMNVSMSGSTGRGPGKIFQLDVEVGRELPTRLRVHIPDGDGDMATIDDAEDHALELLNRDRERHGVPPLVADVRLAEVARAHSEDMRDAGFFAHLSPRTGLVSDRLARAGYRALTHAENLARNDSLAEAQAALMSSVGHRRNILDASFTHVGLGVARVPSGDRTDWLVTQVFARPVRVLDPGEARALLLARVNAARGVRGLEPLGADARLASVAQAHARSVADGAVDRVPEAVIADLRDVNASLSVAVVAAYELDGVEVPEPALDAGATAIGIGVVQAEQDPHGRTGVILVIMRR